MLGKATTLCHGQQTALTALDVYNNVSALWPAASLIRWRGRVWHESSYTACKATQWPIFDQQTYSPTVRSSDSEPSTRIVGEHISAGWDNATISEIAAGSRFSGSPTTRQRVRTSWEMVTAGKTRAASENYLKDTSYEKWSSLLRCIYSLHADILDQELHQKMAK